MVPLKELVIFLAGAQAFHTISHALLPAMVQMPMQLKWPHRSFTTRWNRVAIGINAVVTALLLIWADAL